jgi:DNA-binding transcriptional regulator YdaS (Cro superfamily)
MLNSVDEVIEVLGGTGAVASLVGMSSPAVSNWSKRGRISHRSSMIIRDALAALGKEAAPSVFGFKELATSEARA